jgi:hypothetical protein
MTSNEADDPSPTNERNLSMTDLENVPEDDEETLSIEQLKACPLQHLFVALISELEGEYAAMPSLIVEYLDSDTISSGKLMELSLLLEKVSIELEERQQRQADAA